MEESLLRRKTKVSSIELIHIKNGRKKQALTREIQSSLLRKSAQQSTAASNSPLLRIHELLPPGGDDKAMVIRTLWFNRKE
ncbi:unnamed protein product [Protopolystoma xenopodis]|uniref:Uncharacterized protein n=1 Tax=Protopolystoma xenopodis TaxID=117903 RepID=A0A3S5CVJ8_9PLAT|nr:unnamed protein product [Protopolystoma xenopodis]